LKLPGSPAVHELDRETTINGELLLVKMSNTSNEDRNDILDAAGAFGAKIMDYTRDAIILRLVGSSRRVDDFIDLMRDYQILEICRTGIVSLERGAHTMRSRTKL
jgi:acetolactate synthase-1/3 small subunit